MSMDSLIIVSPVSPWARTNLASMGSGNDEDARFNLRSETCV
jgi:hypothetical protein